MSNPKVWFITGASKGLGLALVRKALERGDRVAATSRNREQLAKALGEQAANVLCLQVDLGDEASIAAAIQQTVASYGRLDVVVNNAGYGTGGALEEVSAVETLAAFEVNVFGTMNVIRQAMPQLRRQRSGHIINISSIAGYAPGAGWTVYASAKFAVTGLSESLAQELEPLGIKVTVVMPGGFRTNFLSPDSIAFSQQKIDDYSHLHAVHERFRGYDGQQQGDPGKAALVFLQLADMEQPPVHLILGSDALKRAHSKTDSMQANIREWASLTESTDY